MPSKTALHPFAPPKIPESLAARAPRLLLRGSCSFFCSCEASSLTAVQISTHAGLSAHSAPLLSPVIRSRPTTEPSKSLFGPLHRLCTAFGLPLRGTPTERQSGRKSAKQEVSGEHRRTTTPTTLPPRRQMGNGRQETGDRRWLTADGKNNPRQLPPRVLRTNHPTDRTAAREIDQKSEAASLCGGSLATQKPPSDGSGITPRERPRRGPC